MSVQKRINDDAFFDDFGRVYGFKYDNEKCSKTVNEVLTDIAKYLRGRKWAHEQRAEMAVVGQNAAGRKFVLNKLTDDQLVRLSHEYRGENLYFGSAFGRQIVWVEVRNLVMRGDESIVMESDVELPLCATGFVTLRPEKLMATTQELYALMTELISLHMLRLNNPDLSWLRRSYRK